MTKINNDQSRCYGDDGKTICARRYKCKRYQQRNDTGVFFVHHMCGMAGNEFMDYCLEADYLENE